MRERITQFKKNDIRWHICKYYSIYKSKVSGKKKIVLLGETSMEDSGKGYLSWVYIEYTDAVCLLDDFVEWDNYYGLYQLRNAARRVEKTILSPQECFNKANDMLWEYIFNDNEYDGREWLDILKISQDTEPGDYVGQ